MGDVCPHCHQWNYGVSHFTSETQAKTDGRVLCDRPGKRIARGEYWGWACPSGHVCWAGPLPPVPAVEE